MSGGSRDPVLRIAGGGGGRGSPRPSPPGYATSNRELKQPPPRRDNDDVKKIVIFSKITALHVHQSILYISLTITARLRRETFSCDVFWRTWTCDDQFSFLFLSLDIKSLRIQLHENSPTFDILSRCKQTR